MRLGKDKNELQSQNESYGESSMINFQDNLWK